jgi:hypothetical protein
MAETVTRKLTGGDMKPGMILDGKEISVRRNGVGSGKIWTFLTFTDGTGRRVRRNTVKLEIEVPVSK